MADIGTEVVVNDRGIVSRRHRWERLDRDHPPLLFVHGSLDRGSSFVKTVRAFGDYPTVTYDRVGYGESIRDRPVSDAAPLQDQVDDLLSVLPDVPVVAATHSFGGIVALRAVLDHPDRFTALAMFEPPAVGPDEDPTSDDYQNGIRRIAAGTPEQIAERAFRRIMGSDIWEMLPDATQQQCRREGVGYCADIACYYHDVPALTAGLAAPTTVPVPVVIGHGSDDTNKYQAVAAMLHDRLPGSHLIGYPDTPHHGHLARPHLYADMVSAAVAEAVPADEWLDPNLIMDCWCPAPGRTWRQQQHLVSVDRSWRGITKTVAYTKQVRVPVLVDGDQVVDGQHRVLIAAELGVASVPVRYRR